MGIVNINANKYSRSSKEESVNWHFLTIYRDCKSGRHILWHCTISLWRWWHATNLEIGHGHLSHHPVMFWPPLKAHNYVPHAVHWCLFSPLTAVKPRWKVYLWRRHTLDVTKWLNSIAFCISMSPPTDGVNAQSRWPCRNGLPLLQSLLVQSVFWKYKYNVG